MPVTLSSARDRALRWLPQGALLPEPDWRWRHAAVCLVLAAHLPLLSVWALVAGPRGELWHVLLPLAALLAASQTRVLSRTVRSLAAAAGLLTCSAVVVHLSGAGTEGHFHFFVAVAVVALYQDWAVYALAVAFVLVHHGVVVAPSGGESWGWALTHAAYVLAESAVLVLFWRANEMTREAEARARAELTVGQDSVRARIAAADRIREDLIGTVSHEFRTPLTGIRGNALTLLKRGHRVDEAKREELLKAILVQEQRLSRLLENMLLASQATAVDPAAATDVEAVATAVANAADEDGSPVSVVVEEGLIAHIDRKALEHVLGNLLENAAQHGAPGSQTLVAGGLDEGGVWLRVSNEGRVLDLTDKRQLFRPFTQVDSSTRREREGIGVGLYVVQRLVEVYGGSVDVDSHSGWVTVEVRLRPGSAARPLAGASS
jgi:signal transduction histidine kinase